MVLSLLPCVVLLVTLLSLLSPSSAWSTGSGTCYALRDSVTRQTGRHPLTENLGFYLGLPLQYTAGSPLTVSILNTGRNASTISAFNGFLLYAVNDQNRRVGLWGDTSGTGTTDMANAVEAEAASSGRFACDGAEGGTITHSSGSAKKIGQQFSFTPPADLTGRLTFYGLVEWTSTLYYTQVLFPIFVCPSNDDSCKAFDPNTLPNGPLPTPSSSSGVQPFGLQEIDPTACGDFTPIPNAVVPPGFCASLYSERGLISRPRGIYVTNRGDLLVLEATGNSAGVSLLRDLDGDGTIRKGETTRIFSQPALNHGLYVHGGWMYVSSPNTVWRVPFNGLNASRVIPSSEAVIVVKGIPGGGHSTRTTLVSHDLRWLYVSVGSAGNLDNDDSRSRVIRYDLTRSIPAGGWQWNDYFASGGAVQAFAKGLRNEVGLILDLQGDVWGAMNADDQLNRPDLGGYAIHNDNPAERVDHLRERDMNGWYGYPYCWAADILAGHQNGEIFGWGGDGRNWWQGEYDDDWCRENTIPASYALEAHTAPLGLLFYDGRGKYSFPPEYYNQIFVAQHGSWNSDTPRGYKVSRIGTDPRGEALANTSRDFLAYRGPGAISGQWPHKPADVKVGPHGELFVSSPDSDLILVVRHLNPPRNPVTIPRAMGAGYNYSTLGGPTHPLAHFTFDRRPAAASNAEFRWAPGAGAHQGLAVFDGQGMFVNATRADNGAGNAAPNVTGGSSSYELWLSFASIAGPQVLWEFGTPGRTAAEDGYIRLQLNAQGAFEFVHAQGNGSAAERVTQSAGPGLQAGQWWHVVVTVNASSNEVRLYTTSAAAAEVATATFRSPIPLMHRRSALLGRGYRSAAEGGWFHGSIDAFRLYSFTVSAAQVALSYALEAATRIEPAIQINLHMQPYEYSESNWTHLGPNNRYAPQASSLFPGWAGLNGQQVIDLANPASGLAVVWADQLHNATAFSVEMWVRAQWGQQQEEFSLLRAQPLLSLYHAATDPVGSLRVRRGDSGGDESMYIGVLTQYWTQLVLVFSSAQQATGFYLNASMSDARLPAGPTSVAVVAPLLGSGFRGEIAILRVYDTALSAAQVTALYAAQMAEEGRPELRLSGSQAKAEEKPYVPLSFAGIIGVVVGSSALITALIVLYLWHTHRKPAALKQTSIRSEHRVNLLAQ